MKIFFDFLMRIRINLINLGKICLNKYCQKVESIGKQIRKLRKDHGLPLRKVAAELDIDQSILSKIERGKRKATKEQIIQIARIFNVDQKKLMVSYLSDRVLYDLKDEDWVPDVLKVAEEKIKYLAQKKNHNEN